MNIITKTTMKALPLVTMLVLSIAVDAKSSNKNNSGKTVDVKCFVELVGGGETISFWNVPSSKVSDLAGSISNRKIPSPTSKQKVKIFKAYECVLLNESFTGNRAKTVDSKTAR